MKNYVYYVPCGYGTEYKGESSHLQEVRLEEHWKNTFKGETIKLGMAYV